MECVRKRATTSQGWGGWGRGLPDQSQARKNWEWGVFVNVPAQEHCTGLRHEKLLLLQWEAAGSGGRGVIRSGNALPFFFFFCWSRILLLLLYNRYRNLNLKPFQLRLILSLLVVSDAVDDRRRHYHKSAELTMIFRSSPESGWQSPQLGTLSITITFYIKCS